MKGLSVYVFSRTLKEITAPGVQLVSQDAGEFVRKLSAAAAREGVSRQHMGTASPSALAAA